MYECVFLQAANACTMVCEGILGDRDESCTAGLLKNIQVELGINTQARLIDEDYIPGLVPFKPRSYICNERPGGPT